ncbi:AraC-type DNA-binding protein [Alteromonadaceae bacterium Bs31]|nr:AraC-type DNA-binding protein [Alteromonadaceae bacterium Bs31]
MSSELSVELFKVWHIFSVSLGIFTGLNLLLAKKGNKKINYCLVLYVSILLIPSLNAYFQLLTHGTLVWLTRLSQNLTWAYGPLLFIIIQQSTNKPLSRWKICLHMAPFFIVAFYQLAPQNLIPASLVLWGLTLHVFCYGLASSVHVYRKKSRLVNLAKNHRNTTYYWLLFLALGLVVLALMDLTIINLVLRGVALNFSWLQFIAGAIAIYVSVICLLSLYQPEFFYKGETHAEHSANSQGKSSKERIRNVELNPATAKALDAELTRLVNSLQLHLDETLSLDKLAALLGVSRTQLSELFNIHKGLGFYEYMNNMRFEEALKILETNNSNCSIADIAYQAGFNNRNTFYKVFKNKTGLTPSAYRNLNRAQSSIADKAS